MFILKKDDTIKDTNKNKIILLVVGSLILIIFITFLIIKLSNKQVVYEDKLYYIDLVGDSNITLYLGEEYNEPGYTGKDDNGKDLTKDVAIENNIDVSNVGNYKVTYTLGNVTKERNVKVIEKPIGATHIHLYGDMNIFLYVGEKYEEKGYEVVDTVDGAKLKDKVTINSNVDTSKEGIYHVIYSVTNTGGVTTSIQRTVVVMDRTLSLLTDNNEMTNKNVTINIYAKDEMFDYLVLPNSNKTKERISTYEVSNNGTYKFVMYNTKGESKEKSITISNIDKENPSGSCSGYYKSGISQIEVKANDNVGIEKYVIDGTTYTSSSIKLNKEVSSVNITIYDKAGNSKAISCNLTNKNPKTTTTTTTKTTTTTTTTKPTTIYQAVFEVREFKSSSGVKISYWLYVPEGATTNMPLLVHFHGLGVESDKDNKDGPIRSGPGYVIKEGLNNGTNYKNVIMILPQLPRSDRTWMNYKNAMDELQNEIINTYKIDKHKITISGHSKGCTGAFNYVKNTPNHYAAAVLISCVREETAGKYSGFENFKNVTTIGIYGDSEAGEGSQGKAIRTIVNGINAAGGNASYVSIPNSNHGQAPTKAYKSKDLNLFDWITSQTRP